MAAPRFYPAKGSGNLAREWTLREVKEDATGWAKIVRVDGGWLVFFTMTDYETWRKQK